MTTNDNSSAAAFDPRAISRPDPLLMQYYTLVSLAGLFAFPVLFLLNYFRYRTLQYRFDDEGILMSWGVLFRKEITLTYRRIQDIHLTRNIVQRWMNLANLEIQTASGQASAEMTIEGILEADALRDFLYSKMRGAREEVANGEDNAEAGQAGDEALRLLREIHDEVARLADSRKGRGSPP